MITLTPWYGGKAPVPIGTTVIVVHRDGSVYMDESEIRNSYAEQWSYMDKPNAGDIIFYTTDLEQFKQFQIEILLNT